MSWFSKIRKNDIFPDKLDNADVLFYTEKDDYGTVYNQHHHKFLIYDFHVFAEIFIKS